MYKTLTARSPSLSSEKGFPYWTICQEAPLVEDSHSQRVGGMPPVTEYREPAILFGQLPLGWLTPTTHVGQFRLVVKCEVPRKLLLVEPLVPY